MRALAAAALLMALLPAGAVAQAADRAIEVTADQGVEWDKTQKLYVARGNARLTRGQTTISAGVLRAWYRDGPGARGEVFRVEAEGDVRITRGDLVATGARGTYEVDRRVGRLTGAGLAVSSGDARLSATDSIELHDERRVVIARGGARLMRPGEELRGAALSLHLDESGGRGRNRLARIEAEGDVRVTSCAGIVQAQRVVYDPNSGDARLSGDVRMTRGNDRLEGAEAEINTKSGSMRVTSAPRGRVAVTLDKSGGGAPQGAPCR